MSSYQDLFKICKYFNLDLEILKKKTPVVPDPNCCTALVQKAHVSDVLLIHANYVFSNIIECLNLR